MKTIKYFCNHCDHHFEAEEKEGIECPRCFWSSSVAPEEDRGKGGLGSAQSSSKTAKPKGASFQSSRWIGILFAGMTLGLLILTTAFVIRFRSVIEKKGIQFALSEKPKKQEKTQPPGKPSDPALSSDLQPQPAALSVEEQAVLDRRIALSADRPVSEDEQKILSHQAPLKIGRAENLPSQPFSLEKFKQMLDEQQKMYHLPLERSYRGKLEKVFKEKYLAAQTAFEQGNLLQARDLWVESLIFPVYANDIRKHRGVVLTMLKPFIGDTLSKIGSINHSLVEDRIRSKEQEVVSQYQSLTGLILKKDWEAAVSVIQGLNRSLDELDNPELLAGKTPPYSASSQKVDQDIRATLFQLLEVPPPPTAALNPVRADIQNKLKVAESFLPARMIEAEKKYGEALDAVSRKDWKTAEALLLQIETPLALKQDAQDKIRIIRKIQANAVLNENSVPQSGDFSVPIKVKK